VKTLKLNHECVRDSLLVIERDFSLNDIIKLDDFEKTPDLAKYTHDELLYSLSKLYEANFIHAEEIRMEEGLFDIRIQELTWEGHAFLDNIRDPKVWKNVKKEISNLKSVSLPIIAKMCADYIKGLF